MEKSSSSKLLYRSSDLTGEISCDERRQSLILPTSECQSPSSGRDPDPPCLSHRPRAGVTRLTETGRYFRYQRQPRRIPPACRCRKENLRQERLHPLFTDKMLRYLFLFLLSPYFFTLFCLLELDEKDILLRVFLTLRDILPYKSDQNSEPSL